MSLLSWNMDGRQLWCLRDHRCPRLGEGTVSLNPPSNPSWHLPLRRLVRVIGSTNQLAFLPSRPGSGSLFGTVSLLPSNPEGFPFETDRIPFRKGTWAGFDPGSTGRCKRHPRAIGGRTEAIRLRGKQLARAWLPSDRTRRRKEVEEAVWRT